MLLLFTVIHLEANLGTSGTGWPPSATANEMFFLQAS